MIEQYEIIVYIEKHLAKQVTTSMNHQFWGYERYRERESMTMFANYWDYAVGLVFVLGFAVVSLVVWRFSLFDFAGLTLNVLVLALFFCDARTIRKLRK